LPFFIQGVKGVSPTYSGYVTMPLSIVMVLLSMVIGRQITKTGKYKRFAMLGMPFLIGGMLLMAYMDSIWMAVLSMIVFGAGLGFSMQVFSLTVQNAVSPKMLGVATATSALFRNLGATIGIAVMGTIMSTSLVNKLKDIAASGASADYSKLDPAIAKQLAEFQNPQMLLDQPKIDEFHQTLPDAVQPIFNKMIEVMRDALSSSLTTVFLSGAAILVVALALVFFLKEIPLRTSNRMPEEAKNEESGTQAAPSVQTAKPAQSTQS